MTDSNISMSSLDIKDISSNDYTIKNDNKNVKTDITSHINSSSI